MGMGGVCGPARYLWLPGEIDGGPLTHPNGGLWPHYKRSAFGTPGDDRGSLALKENKWGLLAP